MQVLLQVDTFRDLHFREGLGLRRQHAIFFRSAQNELDSVNGTCQAHELCVQVDFLAHTYEQAMPNYKVLQQVFDRIGVQRVREFCSSILFVSL
jgi:hypothetical protein